MKPPRLIFFVGPTASGKTELAIQEAERCKAPVLSCDSLCVYREMNIGTAKPTAEEQARAPHFGIDLVNAETAFSVPEYVAYRDRILRDLGEAGSTVIVVGGSGFYLKSFFSAIADRIQIPPAIKEHVSGIHQNEGLQGMLRELKELHATNESFSGLDLHNPRRVEKALIRCLASGRTYGELLAEFKALPPPLPDWDKEVRLLAREQEDLRSRNHHRVYQMLENGLIDEVRHLKDRGFEKNPSACGAIGYREVLEFLEHPESTEALAEKIILHTNQLIRKQRTWFRHHLPIHAKIPLP